MQSNPVSASPKGSTSGFTLVELMIVVVVIGILVAIAVPSFSSMTARTRATSCISNQRNLVGHMALYVADNGIVDAVIEVRALFDAGAVPGSLCECPDGLVDDRDDYELQIVDGAVVDVTCRIRGIEHEWEL